MERGSTLSDTGFIADAIRHGALLALVIVCAYTDVARGRIYNAVTLPALLLALALGLADNSSGPLTAAFDLLLRLVVGAGVFFLVYRMGGVHAGDVKMMAAVSALAPNVDFVVRALVLTSISGCIIGIAMLAWHGRLAAGLKRSARLLVSFGRAKLEAGAAPVLTMPYGLAISIGAMWTWFFYDWSAWHV